MTDRRYRLDRTTEQHGQVLIGGSPLRLFRLTEAGTRAVDAIRVGRPVGSSRLTEALLDAGAIHPDPDVDGPFGVDDVTVVTPAFGPLRHRRPDAVVVDDGSDPPIPDASVRLPVNRGPGAARNAGLARVETALVAFVDADVDADDDDWLAPVLACFVDERVAAVAPRVRSAGRAGGRLARYETHHSPLDLGGRPAAVRPGSRVAYVPAATIVCRVDALRSVGGFDESLRVGEDVDLVWRLVDAGWHVRYEPAAVVAHEPRRTWRAWIAQRVTYGSSAAPLAARHGDAVAPVRTTGWSIALWSAAVAGHPFTGAAIGAGTATALVRKLPWLPTPVSIRLATLGHLHAGRQLAAAVRRAWWPLVALAAVRSRIARRTLALAVLAAGSPLRLADDVAYSIGVWRGCSILRSVAALRPIVTSWPDRARRR